ncbi:MAG: LysR substrate-binding domain-containing protein [Planctomycetaceae bacterium]
MRRKVVSASNCHFRNAADELLVSQPTLSQQIKDLEAELATPLFERIGRRVRLTQAGETYREYARRALSVLEEGQAVLHEFDDMLRGTLTISVVQTVNSYLTPEIVASFVAEVPHVFLRIHELSADEIEDGVLSGSLDLGISFEPGNGREFDVETLFSEEFAFVVHPGHRLSSRKRVRFSDLTDVPLALLNRAYCTRRIIDAAFREAGVPCCVVVELNSVAGLVALSECGGPPTILPKLGVSSPKVTAIRLEQQTLTRKICLLRATGHAPIRARDGPETSSLIDCESL